MKDGKMLKHKYAQNYTGERGHLHDITVIYEANRYDGVLSGMCEFQGHKLWFKAVDYRSGPEIYYWDPEDLFERDLEDEEMVKEYVFLRFFRAYYIEPEDAQRMIDNQIEWERISSKVWGSIVTNNPSEEQKQNDKDFKQAIEERRNSQEQKDYSEWVKGVIQDNNVIGWFEYDDIKINHRRIDKTGIES